MEVEKAEGEHSERALELGRRADFVADVWHNMGHGPPWWTWWGARRPKLTSAVGNDVLRLGSASALLANLTSFNESRIADASTSRRRSLTGKSKGSRRMDDPAK